MVISFMEEKIMNYQEAYAKLEKINQTHLLKWYDSLSKEEQEVLLNKIDTIDFSVLTKEEGEPVKEVISPIKTLTLDEIASELEEDKKVGLETLKNGKVACLLLAGGMGSRLGSENPKGMYNVGLTRELSIFGCQMETLKNVVKECGAYIHLFVMTSPLNNDATVKFFEDNNYFGYDKNYVRFFIQDEAPITDTNGKVLMTGKACPATAANGNGGWYSSMQRAGLVDFVKAQGIEYINVYAVDNVLQKMADPVYVGACVRRDVEVGGKVVKKADPCEKVGVICLANGHPSITEYIDLTDEMRYAKGEDGEYLYYFGVILNYLFKVSALDKTINESFTLHRAHKAFSYMDDNGEMVICKEPNAYKYETLVLDMIKMMDSCLSFEVDRSKEFAPIKNLHGVDSVDSARELLKANGVEL